MPYVGGKFASTLPEGLNIGHAGAIIARGSSAQEKESALRETGVMIAERPEDLIGLVKIVYSRHVNFMKWKTNITEIRGGEEYIRGTRLSDMIQKSDFVDAIFLLWTGRAPSNEERTMLHALFVSCIDHGVGAPSATVARTVASTGNSVHTALAAGIAAL